MKKFISVIFVIVLALVFVLPVMAAPLVQVQHNPFIAWSVAKDAVPAFGSIVDLLKWLLYSGGVALGVSWLLDKIKGFGNLSPDWKNLIAKGLCVVFSCGVYALLTYVPAEIWAKLDPWFLVAFGSIVTTSAVTAYHQLTK